MVIGLISPPDGDDAADRLTELLKSAHESVRAYLASNSSVRAVTRRFALTNATSRGAGPRVEVVPTALAYFVILGDAPLLQTAAMLAGADLPEAPLQWELPGRWVSALVPMELGAPIHWASDALGAQWLYFANTPAGVLFSDNYRLVSAFVPRQTAVDPLALRRAVVLGYNLGEETLHPAIKLAPPGCVFECHGGNFRILRLHRLEYTDSLAGTTKEAKLEAVDDAFQRSAEAWRAAFPARIGLSLSAGFDSRTALAYFHRLGVKMSCFTFGNPDSAEVIGAMRVAASVGAETQVFAIPDASWQDWQTSIQRLGAIGPVQTVGWGQNWLETIGHHVEALVHGYLGDALTGKHLSSSALVPSDWYDYWTRWSIDSHWHSWRGLKERWRSGMLKDLEMDFRNAAVGPQFAFPHQAALHLDLYCRQRRWVASQPNEIASRMLPVCFFYHPSILRVWASIPLEDLRNQALYHASNRRNFPNLFPPKPSTVGSLVQRLGRKVARTLHLPGYTTAEHERPRVIDRWRALALVQRDAVDTILLVKEALDEVVDVRYVVETLKNVAKRTPTEAECAALIRVVNAAHVLSGTHGQL